MCFDSISRNAPAHQLSFQTVRTSPKNLRPNFHHYRYEKNDNDSHEAIVDVCESTFDVSRIRVSAKRTSAAAAIGARKKNGTLLSENDVIARRTKVSPGSL